MDTKHKSGHKKYLFSILFVLCLILAPIGALAQQMSIASIKITQVDGSQFPDVKIRSIIRDGNNVPVPVSDIANLELLEDNQVVDFTHQQISTNIEVVFVMDLGQRIGFADLTPESRLGDMKRITLEYVNSMQEGDTAGVILVTPNGIEYVEPITSDRTIIAKKTEQLTTTDFSTRSDGLAGLSAALKELSQSPAKGKVIQTVIFMSSGIQGPDEELNDLIELAKNESVWVQSILIREGIKITPLKEIAEKTRGVYVDLQSQGSAKPVYDWIAEQRIQNELTYRSKSGTSSERTVTLQTKGSGLSFVTAKVSFQVTIRNPIAVIETPTNNQEIIRQAQAYDDDLDQVEPTSASVVARVEWPDGFQRAILQAQFLVDGSKVGAPIPFPGNTISFNWDLRPYRTPGNNQAKLQVSLVDELGLENVSEPVNVSIPVVVPAKPPEIVVIDRDPCEGLESTDLYICQGKEIGRSMFATPQGWMSIISMLVALVAIIVALRYRSQIAVAGGQAMSAIRETITRLTRPGHTEVAAYVEMLRGDSSLVGKKMPLYSKTVTPVGRSPEESELVFDTTNERSVVSRRHCEFRHDDNVFRIRDLGSTHGTFVNGIKLPDGGDGQILRDGDQIELGPVERGGILLAFRLPASEPENNPEDDYKTNPAYQEDEQQP